jgi:histidinol-phosphate aminotransferase
MRASYREIELYDPQRTPCTIDLSDNTNLFGVAPAVARVLAAAEPALVTRYPAVFADRLKRALAERHGVSPDNIATGCGSDDLIDSIMRAFCDPGDVVAFPWPTFGVVRTFARMNAARPLPVITAPDFMPDTSELARTGARLTYICAPNNPTGTPLPSVVVEELAANLRGVLLVDEAYADFADDEHAPMAALSERMLSLRTFSKAYGLAGLRVGYAVGPAPLIREVEKSRGPYKVGALAEACALAALEDGGWVRDVVMQIRTNRQRLAAELERLGIRHWPSAANFILLQVPGDLDARGFAQCLREDGIGVRPFTDLPHAGECIRVTIGPWDLMVPLIAALERAVGRLS